MSTNAALREARKRWGKNASLRAYRRTDGVKGKWCAVGYLALGGLFFMNKGESASWREAFADADTRESKDHERIVALVAETEKKS